MEFKEVTPERLNKVDFGTTVVKLRDQLPQAFWGKLNHKQWIEVYTAALCFSPKDKLVDKAFYALAEMPLDFDGWSEVYRWAPAGSDLQALATLKMMEIATTFAQWRSLYYLDPSTSTDVRAAALAKMEEFECAAVGD